MQKKIFITQENLDKWSSAGRVSQEGEVITLSLKDNSRYALRPAVKFLSVETSQEDPNRLVGRIITSASLKERGVEVYMHSAIFRDEAYKVEEGFIGLRQESAPDKTESPVTLPADETKSDEDLLADFLMKNL